uniref:MFS transporter n=1 Tax=Candidatus Fimenecus sp. TaxID=3022888 RepID=UPI004027CEEC
MKLNYKRTLLVGFAFFLICAFWQAYDAIVPLMLTNKFGLSQGASGIIMSLDNILALFMLPLFGALSDKSRSRFGKRTPFILIGTICAIVCFVSLTFVDEAQLNKVKTDKQALWNYANTMTVENKENDSVIDASAETSIVLRDYAARLFYNTDYDSLTADKQAELVQKYANLGYDSVYTYNKETKTYAVYDSKADVPDGLRSKNTYVALVSSAENLFAHNVTATSPWTLVLFIVLLLMTLISMAVFRSPAVALMPDVTVKPLRSKANAIINLMGTAGGILVLLLGMVFGTGKVQNQMMPYTWYVAAVCGIMAVALAVFILTVREPAWNAQMLETQAKLDEDNPEERDETVVEVADQENLNEVADVPQSKSASNKLSKDKLTSLILILASVALWFIGYNAITSKYSVYAVNELNKDYNTTLLIAQAAAVVAYIPVGMIASKLGRKRTILIGVALLTAAFFGAIFVTASSPTWLLIVLFALAGIAWATINVNSFPMVVELAKGSTIGKYTGYYYTASMAAQIVTPILSGYLMQAFGTMRILFPYGTIFVALSFVTMLFVKHGDSKPDKPKDKMEMLAGADD